ncbi:MAG: helix-hairpin-helix domain-containing protein [Coriobacteriales bacterium]|jgi:competence protein ComEA|nr:helix-hairpin-helix domain-containing protein [Coriobacteriales bacterium]
MQLHQPPEKTPAKDVAKASALFTISRGQLKKIVITALIVLVIAGYICYENFFKQGPGTGMTLEPASSTQAQAINPAEASADAHDLVVVDIQGAVKQPGVYRLAKGLRVADAVDAAGGLTKKAQSAQVNLAEPLQDGLQYYIPKGGEQDPATGTSASAARSKTAPGQGSRPATSGSVGASPGQSGLVNINRASSSELQALNGVGPAIAQKIIDYRQSQGPFKSKAELKKVSGIGDKKYAAIESAVCV